MYTHKRRKIIGCIQRITVLENIDTYLAAQQDPLKAALVELVRTAGATLIGIGAVVEKRFEGGRLALADLGVPIETLAVITSMENGKIIME